MIIKLQISDNVYKSLIAGGARVKGSIGLISPTEGNFTEYRRSAPKPGTRYIKLPHGRASVGERVRLTLCINLDESGISPADAIARESLCASEFVDTLIDEYAYESI